MSNKITRTLVTTTVAYVTVNADEKGEIKTSEVKAVTFNGAVERKDLVKEIQKKKCEEGAIVVKEYFIDESLYSMDIEKFITLADKVVPQVSEGKQETAQA
jgi:hypothetical protein